MMKSHLRAAAMAASVLAPTVANAADEITLQLKWVTQAQFAGYYVAAEKGFYEEEDLDVKIMPGGPDITPEQVIAGGAADIITTWMPAALAARERGLPLVNIAQIFQESAQMTTCLKSSGIETPEDFRGKTIGVWFGGNEYPFLTWMNKIGLSYDGADPDITLLKQGFNVDPILQRQADCIATAIYNEYWQIIESGVYTEADLITFPWQDQGVGLLEDGLYVMEERLEDPEWIDIYARFLRASLKGWEYAAANQAETVDIILDNDMTGAQTAQHQTTQIQEIAKLLDGPDEGMGYLVEEDSARTVEILLENEVLTETPEGAYSHVVFEAMQDLP